MPGGERRRAYAQELSDTMDGAQEQHAALTRLFDHYLHTARRAVVRAG